MLIVQPSPFPAQISKLMVDAFYIKRTYCVSSRKAAGRHLNVEILNHIYSNLPTCMLFDYFHFQLWQPQHDDWRRGQYGEGRRRWDTDPMPMGVHEDNEFTRRHAAQSAYYPRRANAGMGCQYLQSRSLG